MKTHGRLLCPVEIRWGMVHIAGQGRSQLLLLPDSIDDYVGPENPVRFLEVRRPVTWANPVNRFGVENPQCDIFVSTTNGARFSISHFRGTCDSGHQSQAGACGHTHRQGWD